MIKYVKVDAIIGKNDEAILNFEKVVRSLLCYTMELCIICMQPPTENNMLIY